VFVRPETGGYHPYHYGSSVAAAVDRLGPAKEVAQIGAAIVERRLRLQYKAAFSSANSDITTESTTLRNSTIAPSPVRLTTRP